jgi:hypothetical protein
MGFLDFPPDRLPIHHRKIHLSAASSTCFEEARGLTGIRPWGKRGSCLDGQGNAPAGGAGLMTVCNLVVADALIRIGYPVVRRRLAVALVTVFLRRRSKCVVSAIFFKQRDQVRCAKISASES